MKKIVSAIVLYHDERSVQEADRCVEALKKQTIAEQLEIILVQNEQRVIPRALRPVHQSLGEGVGRAKDGDSPKDDVTLRRDQSDTNTLIRIQAPRNLGYGAGNNLGVRFANGKFILIINPDNRLEPDALEKMVKFLEEHHDVGIIGPKLVLPNETIRDSYRTFPSPLDIIIKRTPLRYLFKKRMARYLQWNQNPEKARDVDWMCGACLLLKRELYERLEGFDERFFLFFEDCDLCRRIWGLGLRVVYFPRASAHDSEQRLSAGGLLSFFTKKTVRVHMTSAVKYFWKWR